MRKPLIPMTALFVRTVLAVSIAQAIAQPTQVGAECKKAIFGNCPTTHEGQSITVQVCTCTAIKNGDSGWTRCQTNGGCYYPGSSCDMGGEYCIS